MSLARWRRSRSLALDSPEPGDSNQGQTCYCRLSVLAKVGSPMITKPTRATKVGLAASILLILVSLAAVTRLPSVRADASADPKPENHNEDVASVQAPSIQITDTFLSELTLLDGFGGIYLESSDLVVILATKNLTSFQQVANRYFDETDFSVRQVDHTLEELEALHATVIADLKADRWLSQGIRVFAVGVNVRDNIFEIEVQSAVDSISALEMAYGEVKVVEGRPYEELHCVNRAHCANHSPGQPTMAGLYISQLIGLTTYDCSLAFRSRDPQYPGAYYSLTAGHCMNGAGGIGSTWSHGTSLGTALSAYDASWGSVDAGYLLLNTPDYPANQIFYSSSSFPSINGVGSNATQVVGQTACFSLGRSDAWRCGLINHGP